MSSTLSYADTSRWPLVRLRWPAREPTKEAFERTYDDLAAVLGDGPLVVLVTFADRHPHFSASQRAQIAEFIERHKALLEANCKGLAIVSTEADARGLVTALNWRSQAPFQRGMFPTLKAAHDWLRERWGHFVGGSLELPG